MTNRPARVIAAVAIIASAVVPVGCSTTGSNELTCSSTEIAPSTQPGSTNPKAALDWYLRNGNSSLPRTGFERTGSTATRVMFTDGSNQVSVGKLPGDPGEVEVWVVLMTYDCS